MNNNELMDNLIKVRHDEYAAEENLVLGIEKWFEEQNIRVKATIGEEYNFIKLYSTDEGLCNFDINLFLDEFDLELSYYAHGFEYLKGGFFDDKLMRLFYRFELHKR